MPSLATPRQVLTEINGAKNRPWWAKRVFGEVEQILTGMGVIDQYMSVVSIEALLAEAIDRTQRPSTGAELRSDLLAAMLAETRQ